MNVLSVLNGLRSPAVAVSAAGPTSEPCMILVVMLLVCKTSQLNMVWCEWLLKTLYYY